MTVGGERATADLLVVGLGAYGAAVAAAAAAAGASVLGLDRWRPPHALGSSHGASRIIRRVYFEDPLYLPLLERSFTAWRRLEAASGRSLLTVTGGLTLGPPGGELVSGAEACVRRHDLACERLDGVAVARRFPALRPGPATAALFDPAAGVLRPERAVHALLARARAAGAALRFGERVTAWRETGGHVEVETEARRYRGRRLLLAAGAWSGELLAALGGPPVALAVERVVQHWFRPRAEPESFRPGALPVFVWELEDGRIWYGLPDDGDGLKVALHYGGERAASPAAVRREVDPAEVEAVRALLARLAPEGGGEHLRSAVCLYTVTPDLHFRIGRLPGCAATWAISACSGHGFKFAPAVGELLGGELTGGEPAAELAPFAWERGRVA